jgi:hypothetical protein
MLAPMWHGLEIGGAVRAGVSQRLRLLRETPALWALAAITTLGALARLFFLFSYRPGLIGYPDTLAYLYSAKVNLFFDGIHPPGYAFFLRVLAEISPHLQLVTVVQHLFGLVGGLLLFDALRRADVPRPVALVPVAFLMLDGSELLLEHAVLSDALFLFLLQVALWCVVRSWRGSRWWAIAAGLSIGYASVVRIIGIELIPILLLGFLLAPAQRKSWRVGTVLITVVCSAIVVASFEYAHHVADGTWGLASTEDVNLYGRVSPWADCSKFKPPRGTADLCIRTPVADRYGPQWWEFTRGSPMVHAYPCCIGTKNENSRLKSFAIAAIESQPLTYLHYVARDLVRVVDPTFASSPYPSVGNRGYGNTPTGLLKLELRQSQLAFELKTERALYGSAGLIAQNVGIIKAWDRDTRLEGPAMVAILILALLAPLLARDRPRRVAILLLIVAAMLIVEPILGAEYDWRYMVPSFGLLVSAAAIGGWQVWRRAAMLSARRRAR